MQPTRAAAVMPAASRAPRGSAAGSSDSPPPGLAASCGPLETAISSACRADHVDGGVVHDVVAIAAVLVLFDGYAERLQQRRSAGPRAVTPMNAGRSWRDKRRCVPACRGSDRRSRTRCSAALADALAASSRARVGEHLERQRADVRAIREAEEQQRELAAQRVELERHGPPASTSSTSGSASVARQQRRGGGRRAAAGAAAETSPRRAARARRSEL